MSISRIKFGECKKGTVYAYILTNKNGMSVEILNYGGVIRRLICKDTDVVSGCDSLEEYMNNDAYFGAIIGRNSNRIEDARFKLHGREYTLSANDGRNNLHSGNEGFDKRIWDARTVDTDEPALILTLTSPDGEEGFPGTVNVKVTYTLTNDNALMIHYEGESDADTILNMTNHSYFNLNGHNSGKINGHMLCIESDYYTPNNSECMPTGEILAVKGTPFDFTEEKTVEEGLTAENEQIKMFGGFDHNLVLKGKGYRKVGRITGDKSGITMEIYTDQCGMQIYSGNSIKEGCIGKDGAVYGKNCGICFETQAFPNSLKYSHFPDVILRKGEKYETVTTYKFI